MVQVSESESNRPAQADAERDWLDIVLSLFKRPLTYTLLLSGLCLWSVGKTLTARTDTGITVRLLGGLAASASLTWLSRSEGDWAEQDRMTAIKKDRALSLLEDELAYSHVAERRRMEYEHLGTIDGESPEAIAAADANDLFEVDDKGQPTGEVKLFDWKLFNTKPEKYAHIAIMGETGAGKSITAEWLAGWLGGKTVVVAPHFKPGEWSQVPNQHILCRGRRYGKADDLKEENVIPWETILDGREPDITAAAFIRSLYAEMDWRYRLRSQGKED